MTPALPAVAGIGLILGFRHAFEPDHLAAVSTLATRQGSLAAAGRLGLAWALGHTASVAAVVLALIVAGVHLPETLRTAADFLVASLLVGLGASVIYRYARGRWHLHAHVHGPDEERHLHLHSHASGGSHRHTHSGADVRHSLGFGLLHGLAGSAPIVVLIVAAAATPTAQLATFVAFGAGTMLGMLAVSLSLAVLIRLGAPQGVRWARALHLTSAAASVAVGVVLAARTMLAIS